MHCFTPASAICRDGIEISGDGGASRDALLHEGTIIVINYSQSEETSEGHPAEERTARERIAATAAEHGWREMFDDTETDKNDLLG